MGRLSLAAWLGAAAIVLAGIAAYWPGMKGPFLYDDIFSIEENPSIFRLLPFGAVFQPPPNMAVSGRPLVNLSLALNYAVGRIDVRGYHAFNLAVHLAAGLVLFGLVRRTLLRPVLRRDFGARSAPLALAVAALWTLHPLQTEAVTYVIQRAESMMGLCYLLTLYCFARGCEAGRPGAWRWASIACCLMGMECKEVMVSAPVVVFLYDRTFVAGTFREAWRRRWSWHASLAATWILLGLLVASTGGNRNGSVGFGAGVAWSDYALTQFKAVALYLKLAVWPDPLVFEYGPFWVKDAGEVVPYALVVAPLCAGAAVALWKRPALGFAGFWFFAVLAPTSLMPGTTQMIVEHRMYLALAPLLAVLALGVARYGGRAARFILPAAAAAFALLTAMRNETYRTGLALWSDTVHKRPDNFIAQNNLGHVLSAAGRTQDAVEHFRIALRLKPRSPLTEYNLGIALYRLGRNREAIDCFRRAVRDRSVTGARCALAGALFEAGSRDEAMREFQQALREHPGRAVSHADYAAALAKEGRDREAGDECRKAIDAFRASLELNAPDRDEVKTRLGMVEALLGRWDDAARYFAEAASDRPGNAEARYVLGLALRQAGRGAEARAAFREAVEIQPDFARVGERRELLSQAGTADGRMPDTVAGLRRAIAADPSAPDFHFGLSLALKQQGLPAEASVEFERGAELDGL